MIEKCLCYGKARGRPDTQLLVAEGERNGGALLKSKVSTLFRHLPLVTEFGYGGGDEQNTQTRKT